MTDKIIKELNKYINMIRANKYSSIRYIKIINNISILPKIFKFNRGPYQYVFWYFVYYFYSQELK